jgi:phosphoesterase RecJ-like protein
MTAGFAEIERVLARAGRILVASHVRPDGDALGSAIAFGLWLRGLGRDVTVWNEEGVTAKYRYLPGCEIVGVPPGEAEDFDVVVALDTSVRDRLGSVWAAVKSTAVVVNIDHHVSNQGYGELNHIDPSSPATGQIVFEFLRSVGAVITPDIATNLFAAISTDTGSFQYAGTSPRTFRVAAELVEAGVEVAELSRQMYENQPRRRLELLRHALNEARFTCDDHVVSFTLTLAAASEMGVIPEDNEGVIDHLRSVEGVVAAVFFEELEEGRVRVSARSKDARVDVCKVCQMFGGGGHPLAAGARVRGALAEVEAKFLEAVWHEVRNRN